MEINKSNILENTIKYLFIFFILSMAFSISITEIISALIFIVLIIKLLLYPENLKKFKSTPLLIPIIIYLIINGFAVLFGINHIKGMHELAGLMLLLIYILTYNLVNKDDIKLYIFLFIIISIIAASIGIVQYFHNTNLTLFFTSGATFRITGPFSGCFSIAWFLTYSILVTLPLFWQRETSIMEKILLGLALFIMVMALIFTYTRSAWVGTMVGSVIIFFYKDKKILLPIVGFLLIAIFLLPSFKNRLQTLNNIKYLTNQERIEIWKAGLSIIKENPILGIGPGNYSAVAPKFNEPNGKHPHNNFIQHGAETGILGLVAFLFLMGGFIKSGFLSIKKNNFNNNYIRNINIGCFASLIAFLIIGLFDCNINDDMSITPLWFLMGIMMIIYKDTIRE